MLRSLDALALIAVVLLVINGLGLVRGNDQRALFDERVLGHAEALASLDAAYGLHGATPEFLREAVQIVDRGTVYRWIGWKSVSSEAVGYVPLTQNWILWAMRWTDPWIVGAGLTDVEDLFTEYQFLHYDRALQRGFGICSQLAILQADLLTRRYGIPTRVVGLDGHVVAQAELQGRPYLLDPSAGVFMPFGLEEAQGRPDDVARAYPAGSALAGRYDAAGNVIMDAPGGAGYRPRLFRLERLTDVLRWVIPLVLLAAWAVARRWLRRPAR